MADAIFDKEGNIANLQDLTAEDVATAYKTKNKELYDARVAESEKARLSKERADKLEADQEAAKKAKELETQKPDISEELKLMARGLSDEELDKAKKVAKGEDIPLAEALKSEMFLAWQKEHKAKLAAEAAKLGPTGGSDQGLPVEGIKPGMTKDDHKAIWNKALGK